jgi:ribosomal-protein-alanine N-acetyltransferase
LPEAQPQELTKARPQQLLEAQGLQLPEAQAQELPEAQAQKFPPGAQGAQSLELLQPVQLLAPEHLEACVALDRQALNGLWSRQQWGIELADPQRPGLGIWQRRQLLAMACAWLIVDELHIILVAVDPSQRRQGLGRRILTALLQEGSRLGAQRATLEVASGNQAAQSLYASLGFEVAGCRRGYYSNGDDALIEWLKLRV